MFGELAAPVLSLLAQEGVVSLPGHHCQGGWVGLVEVWGWCVRCVGDVGVWVEVVWKEMVVSWLVTSLCWGLGMCVV